MKTKLTALLLAFVMLAAVVCCSCTSSSKNEGTRVQDNIARMYERTNRKSHFMLNDKKIEGDVLGMAYLTTSAAGKTTLAWVKNNLYFVSEKGIDELGSEIEIAEISFDGRIALWLDNGTLYKYCVDDRSKTVLAEGLDTVIQFSISPNSKTILATVVYADKENGEYVTLKCDDNGVTDISHSMICFAVSDDADIMYYYDQEERAFTVKQGEDVYQISKGLSTVTNYNFTRDLSEVTFNDKDGLNHLFCLDTKKDTTMGSGFGITEKTDVFSISTVTCYTYINDIDSFRNGVWMERRTVESSYVYDLGYINSAGEVDWLVKDSIQYYVPQDQSRIIWLSPMSRLSTTAVPSGKTVEIAQDAVSFDALADGSRIYYRTAADSLFTVKGSGSAKKVASSIADFAVIDGVCSYITSDGAVHYAEGTNVTDVSSVTAAVRFDKRAGMLILYANQQEGAGEDAVYVYDAYCSANGREYTLAYSDVEP